MQSWKHESIFAEYINEEDLLVGAYIPSRQMTSPDSTERFTILGNTVHALQQLQRALMGHEGESYWIGQLLQYIQRLQASSPAQTPDEQFSHLYLLRKWLFWVPVLLLERQGSQGPAMLTLAHFYATALALEPMYPDLGSAFCARVAFAPLETIISVTEAMQSQRAMDQNTMEIASLMQYPQQMAMRFRTKILELQQGRMASDSTLLNVNPETLSYTSIGNLSPAFAPSPLHSAGGHLSSSQSSYLEVPVSQSGFTYGTQSWGAIPSPGFPPLASQHDDQLYGYSLGGFRGGFVTPAPIWT